MKMIYHFFMSLFLLLDSDPASKPFLRGLDFKFPLLIHNNTYQWQTGSRTKHFELTDQIQSSKNSRTLSEIGRLSYYSALLWNKAGNGHDCQNFPPSSSSNNCKSVVSHEESEPREPPRVGAVQGKIARGERLWRLLLVFSVASSWI